VGGDLGGTGVEAGVETGVGLFMDKAGVADLGGVGVGVLEGGAGDGVGVLEGGMGVDGLDWPSRGSGICSPCL